MLFSNKVTFWGSMNFGLTLFNPVKVPRNHHMNSGSLLKLQAEVGFWQDLVPKQLWKNFSGAAGHYGANWLHRHGFMSEEWNSKCLWAQLMLTLTSSYWQTWKTSLTLTTRNKHMWIFMPGKILLFIQQWIQCNEHPLCAGTVLGTEIQKWLEHILSTYNLQCFLGPLCTSSS